MKSIIFAIVCLAATVTAADVCSWQCTSTSGNWTGDSSIAIELGQDNEIIYDVNYKIFAVVNVRLNLVFATNGKFLLILNTETGGYVLIDVKTSWAVYGKIEINFKNSDGSIDRTKLIIQLNILLTKYDSITSSTSSSFNFNLIIQAFYSLRFDLSVVLSGRAELVAELNASFGVWFRLIQQQIVSGSLQLGRGIWGFVVVLIEVDIEIALAIIEVIRVSVEFFGTLEVRIIVELVRIIQYNIRGVIEFSAKLAAVVTTGLITGIGEILEWINSNSAVNVTLKFGSSTYSFSVIRIKSAYVIRFTLKSSSGRNIDIQIVLVRNVLLIVNLETNIAVAFYGRSFVVVNVTSDLVLIGTWRLLGGVSGALVVDSQLGADILAERYVKVAEDVVSLVNKHKSSTSISFSALYKAIVSGSVTSVGAVVGQARASGVLIAFGGFFAESSGSSFGGLVIGVYGDRRSLVAISFTAVVNTIVTTTGNWNLFVQLTGLGRGGIKIGGK